MIYKEMYASDIRKAFYDCGRGGYFSPRGYEELYDALDETFGEEGYRFDVIEVCQMFNEMSAADMVRDYGGDYLDDEDLLDDDGEPLDDEELAEIIAEQLSGYALVKPFESPIDPFGHRTETRYLIGR